MRTKGSKNKKKLESTPKIYGDTIKLTLKSLGRVFKSEGSTVEEALRKIKISGGAKAMCVLRVEKGDQIKERIINGNYAQKLFSESGPTMKDFALRKIIEMIGL